MLEWVNYQNEGQIKILSKFIESPEEIQLIIKSETQISKVALYFQLTVNSEPIK